MTTDPIEQQLERLAGYGKDQFGSMCLAAKMTDFPAILAAYRIKSARVTAAEQERDKYLNICRHTHKAHYITIGDKDILTDKCDDCGLDLRDDIHRPEAALAARESEVGK